MATATTATTLSDSAYRRELGNGLMLRWSAPDDVERVAALYQQGFRRSADAPLSWSIPLWTRDMFSGRHPHIGPRDFAVVEDTRTGTLVAATCLLRYTVEYEGIPLAFGRPEMVASLQEYRRRGLIRAIFELIHARSEAEGDQLQGITGIPYYYRQFGYEYAVELEHFSTVYFAAIPPLKAGAEEPYTLREATIADADRLRRLWDRERAGTGISTVVEDAYWRWRLDGMHPDALERHRPLLIADRDGRVAGSVLLAPGRWGQEMYVDSLVVDEGVPLAAAIPSVLRGLVALADTTKPVRADTPPAAAIALRLPTAHPAHTALLGIPAATRPYVYAWYLRVPDLPAFIRTIAPALERRLAASPQSGYSGELTLDFYRGGLRLAFEQGRLVTAEDWRPPLWAEGKAGFPPLVFLQLLFGYRDLGELRAFYSDVWAEGDADPTLRALFPKMPAMLMPLD